jgi:hypothetical protein
VILSLLARAENKTWAVEVILKGALEQLQNHMNEIAKTPTDSFFA